MYTVMTILFQIRQSNGTGEFTFEFRTFFLVEFVYFGKDRQISLVRTNKLRNILLHIIIDLCMGMSGITKMNKKTNRDTMVNELYKILLPHLFKRLGDFSVSKPGKIYKTYRITLFIVKIASFKKVDQLCLSRCCRTFGKEFKVELLPTLERPRKTTSLISSGRESTILCADLINAASTTLGLLTSFPSYQK